MKYKYSIEMTPKEVGGLMRAVGANLPALVEGVLQLAPLLRSHVKTMLSEAESSEGEATKDNVLRVVWPVPDASPQEDSTEGAEGDVADDEAQAQDLTVEARLEQYNLTPRTGLMRTLGVAHADEAGVIITERGLSDRPATYEGEGFTIALNWPTTQEFHEADDAWYDFLNEWCMHYEVPAADPEKEAERRPKMLHSLIGTRRELLIKKHIIFGAGACLNRAVYHALKGGLAEDGHEADRFTPSSLRDLVKLSDHISANITLVAHGSMPELRILHDITGKWSSLLDNAKESK